MRCKAVSEISNCIGLQSAARTMRKDKSRVCAINIASFSCSINATYRGFRKKWDSQRSLCKRLCLAFVRHLGSKFLNGYTMASVHRQRDEIVIILEQLDVDTLPKTVMKIIDLCRVLNAIRSTDYEAVSRLNTG